MTPTARPYRLGLAIAAALAGLALAGCDKPATPDAKQVSAGTELDDSVITTKVKAALLTDTQGKGADTSVETRKGEVLLSGFVDSADEQARATSVARNVEGVQNVVNDTSIKK